MSYMDNVQNVHGGSGTWAACSRAVCLKVELDQVTATTAVMVVASQKHLFSPWLWPLLGFTQPSWHRKRLPFFFFYLLLSPLHLYPNWTAYWKLTSVGAACRTQAVFCPEGSSTYRHRAIPHWGRHLSDAFWESEFHQPIIFFFLCGLSYQGDGLSEGLHALWVAFMFGHQWFVASPAAELLRRRVISLWMAC